MNKIILWVITGAVVVGGGYVFLSQKEIESDVTTESPKTMRELLATTKPSQCTFTYDTEFASSTGTVYVAYGNMRGDFKVLAKQVNQNMDAYMILKDQKVYVWSGMMSQGVELDSKTFEESTPSDNAKVATLGFDQEVNYDCESWNVDNSIFDLPKNITFSVNPTFDVKSNSSTGAPAISCDTCKQVGEGDARNQCLVALGCK